MDEHFNGPYKATYKNGHSTHKFHLKQNNANYVLLKLLVESLGAHFFSWAATDKAAAFLFEKALI